MRVRGLAVVVSIAAASAGILAQDKLTFRAESNYVEVDAIVTDAHCDIVRGLTAADFVVKENGKRQSVTSFDVVDLPTTGPAATGTAPRLAPNVPDDLRNVTGRVYLIYLAVAPAATSAVARQATEFIERYFRPDDVAAVWTVASDGQPIAFTSDRTALLAAITAYATTSQPL